MEMNSLTQAKALMEDIRKRMTSSNISYSVDQNFESLYRAKIMEEGFAYSGEPDYQKMAWFVKPEKNGT